MTASHSPGLLTFDARRGTVVAGPFRQFANGEAQGQFAMMTSACVEDDAQVDQVMAENARRVVACWNAFDGVSTADIEASARARKDDPRLVPSTEKDLHESVKEAIVGYRVKAGRAMNINDFADAIAPLFYSLLSPAQTPQAAGAIDARGQATSETECAKCVGTGTVSDRGFGLLQTFTACHKCGGTGEALASPQEAPPAAGAAQAVAFYIDRRIIDPATGKIGNHVKSALTWSDAPSGNWTTPVYLAVTPAPAAAKVQAVRTGPPGAPSTYVNDADIVASDGPGVVVRKLDDAFHRRQTSTPKK